MNHDIHVLLACLIGVIFSGLLLTAAGSDEAKTDTVPLKRPESKPAPTYRRAA